MVRCTPPSIVVNWFCIHTRPARERPIVRYCNDHLGLETYFPQLRRPKIVRRVRREVVEPLFPRYFFCRLDAAQHFRAVRYAPDVIDVVCFGGCPAIVDESIVSQLRAWAGNYLDIIAIEPGLQVGDTVRITTGPFQGLEAIVQQATNHTGRVAVLLSILSCGARLTIDRSCLEQVA